MHLGEDPGEFVLVLDGVAAGRLTIELTRDELFRVLLALSDLAMAAGALPPALAEALHEHASKESP